MREVSSSTRVSRTPEGARSCVTYGSASLHPPDRCARRAPAVLVPARGLEVSPASRNDGEEPACVGAAGPWIVSSARADARASGAGDRKSGCDSHFLREGCGRRTHPEGPRDRGARPSRAASSDAGEIGCGRSTTTRSSSVGTSRPTTAAAWSTSCRARESIECATRGRLNGLGQCVSSTGRSAHMRRARHAARAFDERANDLLDEEGIATGTGLDPGGEPAASADRFRASRRATSRSLGGEGRRDSRSTRADHAGRYSGRVVASSSALLPADSGARRRSVSISSAASLAGRASAGPRPRATWARVERGPGSDRQNDWKRRVRRASGSSSEGASAGSGAPRSSSQKASAIGSTGCELARPRPTALRMSAAEAPWSTPRRPRAQLDDGVEGEHASVGERAGIVERHAAGNARRTRDTGGSFPRRAPR